MVYGWQAGVQLKCLLVKYDFAAIIRLNKKNYVYFKLFETTFSTTLFLLVISIKFSNQT